MSAFKRFDKQDAYITTYISHKKWTVRGDEFENLGIVVNTDIEGNILQQLKHQYYPDKVSTQGEESVGCEVVEEVFEVLANSNEYYYQTTLHSEETRNISPGAFEIIIPSSLYGVYINPGVGLQLVITEVNQLFYVNNGYWEVGYANDPVILSEEVQLDILDDQEGGLYVLEEGNRRYIGDIIYTHGRIVITDPIYSALLNQGWNPGEVRDVISEVMTRSNFKLSWESSLPIFTYNYNCKLREFEYNYTLNPTVQENQYQQNYNSDNTPNTSCKEIVQGVIKPQFLIEEFTPYITTVGLYNDTNELIAVGKLSLPVPKSQQTEMTITVKLDI